VLDREEGYEGARSEFRGCMDGVGGAAHGGCGCGWWVVVLEG
jgi:hypothetical protein